MRHIEQPSIITAAGNKPKMIEEFIGRVNSQTDALSIARMKSPAGWMEPGQRPEFDEYTVVLSGRLIVSTENDQIEVTEGQAVAISRGEWVRYGTPEATEYLSVCLPAFSPELVNRDDAEGKQ